VKCSQGEKVNFINDEALFITPVRKKANLLQKRLFWLYIIYVGLFVVFTFFWTQWSEEADGWSLIDKLMVGAWSLGGPISVLSFFCDLSDRYWVPLSIWSFLL